MDIPVFLSCPTALNKEQEWSRNFLLRQLKRNKLEPRALGRSDYPTDDNARICMVKTVQDQLRIGRLGFESLRARQSTAVKIIAI